MTSPRVTVHGPEPISLHERARLARALGVTAEQPLLPEPGFALGWKAIDSGGELRGMIVDDAMRPAVVQDGDWIASSAEVFAALYTSAADAWTARGVWTHQVVVRDGDPIEAALTALGFGHRQAHGIIRPQASAAQLADGLRSVDAHELDRLLPLVPLIAAHQAKSPVFAPRSDEFLRELDASFLEWAATDDVLVFAHVEGDDGPPVGFVAVDAEEAIPEIVLAAVAPIARGRGIGRSLMQAVNDWAVGHGITELRVDWRTTNPEAHRFWTRAGATVSARRWSRTIDPTPE